MKRIWISALLLTGLFISCLAHGRYVSTVTGEVIDRLEQAEEAAELEQWETADRHLRAARQLWEKHSDYLHTTLQHRDVDSVDLSFRETIEFLESRERGEFSASNARLIGQLTLLAGAEQLTAQNIL